MPKFHYQARDKQGREVSGEVEAADRLRASLDLRAQDLWITRLDPRKAQVALAEVPTPPRAVRDGGYAWRPVRAATLANFFAQLGELLEAGVNAYDAMTSLPERVSDRLRPVVRELASPLARGEPLSEQLARFPHVFSSATVGLMRAGERSGELGAMCRLLAEQHDQDHRVWLSLLPTRLYGAILIPLAVLVPTFPRMILWGWAWYRHRLLTLLLPLIVVLFVLDWLVRLLLRRPWAAGLRQDVLWYLPGAAGYYRAAALSRVLTTMAAVTRSGGSFAEGLGLAAQAAGPGRLGRQLAGAAAASQAGDPLGVALGRCTLLPFTARSALLTAEQAGSHEQTLRRLADIQLEEMRSAPRRLALAGTFAGLGVFAVITLIAAAYGWLNYFNSVFQYTEGWTP